MSEPCSNGAPVLSDIRVKQAAGRLGALSPKQQQAIGLMLSGCSMADTARRAGVSRGTLYKWRRNERFLAAMESWRSDMQQAARSRLLNLSGMALKTILRALEGGDAKVALAIFKGLGVFATVAESKPEEVIIVRRAVDRSGGNGTSGGPVAVPKDKEKGVTSRLD